MKEISWKVEGQIKDWHYPSQFRVFAHCPQCRHCAELHLPSLIERYGFPWYAKMERLRARLACRECGRTSPTIRRLAVERKESAVEAMSRIPHKYGGVF